MGNILVMSTQPTRPATSPRSPDATTTIPHEH
jgi:hypothetical protein